MSKIFFNGFGCLLLLCAVWALPASAQSSESETAPVSAESAVRSGAYQFGGPSSVGGTLHKDSESEGIVHLGDRSIQGYFDFKQQVKERYGLSFGFDYNALFQTAIEGLDDENAAGGVVRIFGQWTLIGRGSENRGMLVYKVENRHRLGTDIAPKDLGFETGYAGLTTVPFSDIGWALTNLYWNQHLLDNRLGFVVGVVDTTDYVDVGGLVDPWNDFSNLAFSNGPTIPSPGQGMGVAARVMATDNFYVLGGIADANGDPTEPENAFDSFFDDAEFFTHMEVGWIDSWERRFSDNIHLTAWHIDEREKAGTDAGWGVTFSFSRLFEDTWEPFFRAGYAEDGGALWEGSISAGLGYHIRKQGDVLGVGLNWSRPSEDTFGPGLDDQYTAEIYYRFQLLKVLTITPDVQLIVDPALNPDKDVLVIFGIRGRISF